MGNIHLEIDIQTAFMKLSGFRTQLQIGQFERINQGYSYRIKYLALLRQVWRQKEPDFSTVSVRKHDWSNSTDGNGAEDLQNDAPESKGQQDILSPWYNTNFMHDVQSGKSVIDIFHMANLTPIMWYVKKQEITETATYGTDSIVARNCMKQIVDFRNIFQFLGIPV